MWDPIYQNFAQKFWWYAHFSSFSSQFPKISNFFRAMNFCRTETLSIYEKASIFDEECDEIKNKQFSESK